MANTILPRYQTPAKVNTQIGKEKIECWISIYVSRKGLISGQREPISSSRWVDATDQEEKEQ